MSEFIDLSNLTKIKEIGHGAFGVVYKVSENRTNEIFAAKISFSKLNKDDITLITDLKREVNILSQLKHPSVLKFIGYSPYDFKNKSRPVIITEYSSNGSLDDIIKLDRKHLASETWTDTKKLINIYGIAAAMKYLHSHNIIHRDLKPANILEDENFFPKIADFGLSKTYNKKSESKSTAYPKGTPIYIAPEIWSDNEYSKAGDVYAFAIIVYEILTLDEPFKNFNCYSLMSQVAINGKRPEIRYPLPECYEKLIERCWSANPEERPTFNVIVKKLRTDKNFIIDTIDKKEYFNYIDSIDYSDNSFNPNKKLKTLLLTKKSNEDFKSEKKSDDLPKKNAEEVSDESLERNVEQMITVKAFNDLSLKSQIVVISNIIENCCDDNKEFLFNLKKILNYLNELFSTSSLPSSDKNYIYIITKEKEITIEEILRMNPKISISHEAIEKFKDQDSSKFTEFLTILTNFERVMIEIKYPIPSFDKLYEQILTYKSKYSDKIRISIFISGITKTDMRFRRDKNIDSVLFDNDVSQITGEFYKKEKNGERRGGGSFFVCSSLRKILFSSSISVIGEYAFTNCLSLIQIKIPSSVTKIGNFSFCDCKSLTQVSFETPSSVTEIGEDAFYKCTSLTQISLPTLITEIKSRVFMKCLSLTRIEIPSSVTSIENYSFYKCTLLRIILIPSSVTKIGEYAFSECSSLSQITFEIPSSVTRFGKYAFFKCTSLTQISIPSSVTKIWKNTFSGCSSLKQIVIPSSITEIGEDAFSRCSSLTQITFKIPSSVTIIWKNAFFECLSLTQVEIPSSITEIGENAFYGCSSLTQVAIPSSITKIGKNVFAQCPLLKKKTVLSHLESQEKATTHISQVNLASSLNVSFDQAQIIDNLISSQNASELITYLHNSCNNDTISAFYENCFKTSPNFYISLIKEGVSINDAVSHHKFAINCIIDSSKQEMQNKSKDKLNEAVSHLKESIKNGYLFSYLLLSLVYHSLLGKSISAFNVVKEGATQGEKYCKCLIGYFIAHGIGTTKNFMNGVHIILSNKVSDFYENFATDIGIYYTILAKEEREETDKISDTILNANKVKAFEWFEKAFNMNKTKATINNIGVCYLKGYGVEQNIEKAKDIFQLGLNQNDPNSMYHIGFIYEKEDPIKSLYYYKQAADKNHVYAQLQYAFFKLRNDKEEALYYIKMASKQGENNSQLSLANLIIKSDPDKSLALYKKAAEKGNIEAQKFLAMKFSKENDMENFDKYCKMLIKSGNTKVPLEFAVNLYKSKKFKLSFYYFSILCSINHPIARYFMGVMKFYGQGCVQDKNESLDILSELSKQGIEEATNFIEDHFN